MCSNLLASSCKSTVVAIVLAGRKRALIHLDTVLLHCSLLLLYILLLTIIRYYIYIVLALLVYYVRHVMVGWLVVCC